MGTLILTSRAPDSMPTFLNSSTSVISKVLEPRLTEPNEQQSDFLGKIGGVDFALKLLALLLLKTPLFRHVFSRNPEV